MLSVFLEILWLMFVQNGQSMSMLYSGASTGSYWCAQEHGTKPQKEFLELNVQFMVKSVPNVKTELHQHIATRRLKARIVE